MQHNPLSQNALKQQVGKAGAAYILEKVPEGSVLGIGTGSTVNYLIDALAEHPKFAGRYRGAVSTSAATTARLQACGMKVIDLNEVDTLPLYMDGADEIDGQGRMIKGGGGALTQEKVVAMVAQTFICLADASKRVEKLGAFALPIEVLPIAQRAITERLKGLGGMPTLRRTQKGEAYTTCHTNLILDVAELDIPDPIALENEINSWPGVVTVGLFARRGANSCLLAGEHGVELIHF